jgi:ABC-type branched-subunit amino acid transport system ATPase component
VFKSFPGSRNAPSNAETLSGVEQQMLPRGGVMSNPKIR